MNNGLSVRALEALVRDDVGSTSAESEPAAVPTPVGDAVVGATKPPALLELEELLGDRFATKVGITLGNKRGRMTIDFADIDDLERIYALMTDPNALP